MGYKNISPKMIFDVQFCSAVLILLCMNLSPAFARDSFGLIDLKGKEIIPCMYRSMEYVGCGLYLAEEMPELRTQLAGSEVLSSIPRDLLALIQNHEKYSSKILLARTGKKVLVPIPKDAVLTGIS